LYSVVDSILLAEALIPSETATLFGLEVAPTYVAMAGTLDWTVESELVAPTYVAVGDAVAVDDGIVGELDSATAVAETEVILVPCPVFWVDNSDTFVVDAEATLEP
jgi:hypothetical protein